MTNPKYHWAVLVSDPSKHRHAWKGYTGGHFIKACGRKYSNSALAESASEFVSSATKNPDWYCVTCATKARLALAAESAPKPDAMTWPKPRPISDAPKDTRILAWEIFLGKGLGWIVVSWDDYEARWIDSNGVSCNVTHFLPLPPEVR